MFSLFYSTKYKKISPSAHHSLSFSLSSTHTHSEENLQHKRWRDIWWRLLSAKGRRARMCQTHKKSMANKSKCLQWKEAAKIKKTGWIWYADMTALWYKEDRNITERCTAQVLHLTSVQLTGSCYGHPRTHFYTTAATYTWLHKSFCGTNQETRPPLSDTSLMRKAL